MVGRYDISAPVDDRTPVVHWAISPRYISGNRAGTRDIRCAELSLGVLDIGATDAMGSVGSCDGICFVSGAVHGSKTDVVRPVIYGECFVGCVLFVAVLV